MPIIIKDFTSNQTESTLTIKIPIKGVIQAKTDVFTSPNYIKASYETYFFELFPKHPIVTDASKCIFTENCIQFELQKKDAKLWDELEVNVSKQEKQELKMRLIQEEHERMQEKAKKLVEKKSELKKTAVRQQIRLDTKQRQLIDEIKTQEKEKALGDVNKWKNCLSAKKTTPKFKTSAPAPLPTPIPLPRTTTTLQIDFTPREFPTPLRESQAEEEEEWLRKQAIARRSVGFVSEDLRPEERNPQYLKEKGDEFLKAGNYLGAISAYSFGIKLRDTFPDFYVGRAAAHLAHGKLNRRFDVCQ